MILDRFQLNGKTALVTGARRGIGLAMAAALAEARTCYDHLAGRAGVELLEALIRHGLLTREKQKSLSRTDDGDSGSAMRFEVTGAGAKTFASFGIK